MFQHTAARRWLLGIYRKFATNKDVSTHSRAESAAKAQYLIGYSQAVSTHSRAEAAADLSKPNNRTITVSTHSRAEAAASTAMWTAST